MIAPQAKLYHKIPDDWEPIVYSKKIDDKTNDNVVFTNVFNRDYEGELRGIGSELVIRSWPDIKVNDYILDTPINPQRVDSRSKHVKVGRAWEASFVLDGWDLMNTDIKGWEAKRSSLIAVRLAEFLEDKWFREAPATLAAAAVDVPEAARNIGNSAGFNGDIKLGEPNQAIELMIEKPANTFGTYQRNVVDYFYDCDMVLSRQKGASAATKKFIICAPEVFDKLRRFDAFERSHAAPELATMLRADILSAGKIPVTGMDVYISNRLKAVGTSGGKSIYPVYFGDTRAWTYADLVSKTGVKEDPKIPEVQYEWHIGAYDWFLAAPEYFGVGFVAV